MNGKEKHRELCLTAIHWLYKNGCSIFANEIPTWNGIADAVGIKTNNQEKTYYIEAKASRSDLLCNKQKICNYRLENIQRYQNDIDYFYFILADGIVIDKATYPLWGIIDCRGKVVRKAKRMDKNKDCKELSISIAHTLGYKYFGKLYEIV